MDAFDDIDMGGSVIGVVRVPAERILGDCPESDVLPIKKQTLPSSRNPVDVRNWDGENFILTLTAGVRLSRKALSDCIMEWKVAHPIISCVRCHVSRHPLMNLPIHVLHHCGFVRTGGELMWERDMTKSSAPKQPELKAEEPKTEPESFQSTYWEDRLAACRERIETARKDKIFGNQYGRDLEDEAFYLSKIAEDKARRESPAMKAIDDAIEALQREIDKRTGTA